MLEIHLKALDLCYFEVTEAFKGLADEHVWQRPAPGLLSIGEIAGHVAYWEAARFASDPEGDDLAGCSIQSPLLDIRFRYYTTTLPATPVQLEMTAEQVCAELVRVHNEAMECLKAANLDTASPAPHWHSSYDDLLRYIAFHIAYHTGQMYSARHILGETTPDN